MLSISKALRAAVAYHEPYSDVSRYLLLRHLKLLCQETNALYLVGPLRLYGLLIPKNGDGSEYQTLTLLDTERSSNSSDTVRGVAKE